MILAPGLIFGVVKVSTHITPKGSDVHSSHGLNLPHLVLVRSAMTPITGFRNATPSPITRVMVPACAAVSPKVWV